MRWLKTKLHYFSWTISLVATSGSLYYSEIRHFAPCVLCWYQRILMYPLVFIIMIGILRKDQGLRLYVLPMSILGLVVSSYHILLERGILPETVAPCTLGVSCTIKYTGYFGFVTIPVMSFVAFLLITLCMLKYTSRQEAKI